MRLVTYNLVSTLRTQLNGAQGVYWLVAFTMASGVELLLPELQEAAARGADIKILTGDYLYVTEPEALARLLAVLPEAEIRLWQSRGQSFHAKAYLFAQSGEEDTVIVGSSNWSASAMTSGVEWNLMVRDGSINGMERFMRLFYADRTVPLNAVTLAQYQRQWERFRKSHPDWTRTWSEGESATLMFDPGEAAGPCDIIPAHPEDRAPIPRPAQSEALLALSATREEGYRKALVVLPTGLGKTYLAAFFAKQFRRILFVAHREEILRQSLRTFQDVMPERRFVMYSGRSEKTQDGIFASVYTLAGEAHRTSFGPSEFDLIVVDEFHHAAAQSYTRILQHFQPEFLLGLTATPERTDGRDIFGLCDGNLAYQLSLSEAINREWLAPFWYVGVYDPIDYSRLRWRQTHYDEEDLLRAQLDSHHSAAVFQAWRAHRQTRTLGFCSSVRHAEFLAQEFAQRGVSSTWVHSGSGRDRRRQVLSDMAQGRLDIVFSVDLFNEGIDIPSVDTILMVRPTDSSIVFIQQLGRGLRRSAGKNHCRVIDLIGNYRNADAKIRWLGVKNAVALAAGGIEAVREGLPHACRLDLDLQVIDVLTRLARQQTPRKTLVLHAYQQMKEDLGRPPSYLELHLRAGIDSRMVHQEFQAYAGLKSAAGDLTGHEEAVWERYREWMHEVETTSMVKSYKMVLLKAMLARGSHNWWAPITPKDAAGYFYRYLTAEEYRKRIDFSDKTTRALWEYRQGPVASLIRRMPMTQWSKSSAGWAVLDAEGFHIRLHSADAESLATLAEWTTDVAEYRLHWYFERKAQLQGGSRE